jgi:hypothetical protein
MPFVQPSLYPLSQESARYFLDGSLLGTAMRKKDLEGH